MDSLAIQARLFARGLMERIAHGMTNQERPVIRYRGNDEIIHTADAPFCDDLACPCHYDADLLAQYVQQPYEGGLLTQDEARRTMDGRQV